MLCTEDTVGWIDLSFVRNGHEDEMPVVEPGSNTHITQLVKTADMLEVALNEAESIQQRRVHMSI